MAANKKQTRIKNRTRAAVIRGIADLIEGKDKADLGGGQIAAMINASAFAFELIANFTEKNLVDEASQRILNRFFDLLRTP